MLWLLPTSPLVVMWLYTLGATYYLYAPLGIRPNQFCFVLPRPLQLAAEVCGVGWVEALFLST